MDLVRYGDYFTINRPRQFGKTTLIKSVKSALDKDNTYVTVYIDFKNIKPDEFLFEETFVIMMWSEITKELSINKANIQYFLELSSAIDHLIVSLNKKVVLIIDHLEVQSRLQPFYRFLGLLKRMFDNRFYQNTFHSVVFCSNQTISELSQQMSSEEYNHNLMPYNIETPFEVRMSFIPEEIVPMLEQYSEAENVKMDVEAIAERLYYHTSGYPFLVSKICKNIVEDVLPNKENKTEWTLNDVEESVRILLTENNTNFDDLIKNLENHQDLYDLVFRIVIDGQMITFNPDNATISKGILYGVFKRNGSIKIHNRVYEQRIYNYMISNTEVKLETENYNNNYQFKLPNNELNFQKVIEKFQEFLKQEYSGQDQPFLERQWRIIFLAFLRPILNGSGYAFKEVQISEEKRLDVTITYFQHQYIVELKRWYGNAAHERGVEQLNDYLDRQNQTKGYLVIFEHNTTKTWRKERIEYNDKEIFAVWV